LRPIYFDRAFDGETVFLPDSRGICLALSHRWSWGLWPQAFSPWRRKPTRRSNTSVPPIHRPISLICVTGSLQGRRETPVPRKFQKFGAFFPPIEPGSVVVMFHSGDGPETLSPACCFTATENFAMRQCPPPTAYNLLRAERLTSHFKDYFFVLPLGFFRWRHVFSLAFPSVECAKCPGPPTGSTPLRDLVFLMAPMPRRTRGCFVSSGSSTQQCVSHAFGTYLLVR